MLLQAQINGNKIAKNPKAVQLINKLKNIVYSYDKNAEIILFGSRARGDWHEESDWDFLILTDLEVTEKFKTDLRNKILQEIELPLNEGVFVIVKVKIIGRIIIMLHPCIIILQMRELKYEQGRIFKFKNGKGGRTTPASRSYA